VPIRCGPVQLRFGIGEIGDFKSEMGEGKPQPWQLRLLVPFQSGSAAPLTLGNFFLRIYTVCELGCLSLSVISDLPPSLPTLHRNFSSFSLSSPSLPGSQAG
jgi:hypothetical protein